MILHSWLLLISHKQDSLLAMSKAFVYDPQIGWRLFGQSPAQDGGDAHPYNRNDGTHHAALVWTLQCPSNVSGLSIKMAMYQRESIVPKRPKTLHHIMPEVRIERLKKMILVREYFTLHGRSLLSSS